MSVAGRRLHLEDAVLNRQDGNIESAAAKVKDENIALCANLLVKTVRDGSRRRLVDDPQNVESRDRYGVIGCLALGVVEVRRNGHHRIGHRLLSSENIQSYTVNNYI